MVNWVGIERGYATFKEAEERKEDRAYKRKSQDRLDEEFKENKMLRRVKSVSDFLGDRGSSITVDTAKLASIKRALGDVEGANNYLEKLAASPYAVDTVYKALEDRKSATGAMPTGQELMDNITLIAENYGDESWMKSYKEGRDIYDILLRDPDKLLEDEYYTSVMSRIGALPDVVKPTVGVDITPGYTAKLTPAMINEQVDQFDEAILAYANNQLSQYPNQNVPEAVDLNSDIGNYSDDPTALRQRFGPIVLHGLRQSGGILFQPGLAPNLAPFAIPNSHIQKLKENRDDPQAIEAFNQQYGQGAAELILGS
tara:strand:+ start:399 stop:1337 length:939 start_codon:yes stop_codon:yes gene_type:complete